MALLSTGAYDAADGLSDLFHICPQEDDVQDFDTRRDQILLGTSERHPESVLQGLSTNKLKVSQKLPALLAMYNKN